MKQGTLITRITILILSLGVALYLAVYTVRGLSDPFQTVLTYSYTVDDGSEATGFLVREEQVIPGGGDIMELLAQEGEKIGAGQAVAMVYRDTAALDRRQEIRRLELELEQLDYALRRNESPGDAAQLDAAIFQTAAALKSSAAAGDLTDLEDQALTLRSQVLKRVGGSQSSAGSIAALEDSINAVTAELQALQTAAQSESETITVSSAGVFSGLVDGYETLLTPAMLESVTAAELDALSVQTVSAPGNTVGKLIGSIRWYFAVVLPEAEAARLAEGRQYPVVFSKDWSGEVSMRVERVGESESGRCVVVFSSTRHLSELTLLRRQTVDIVVERHTGVRVPKEALRVITETETDPDTGEVVSQTQKRGVYVVVGAQAEFKAATVVWEGEDFYLLTAAGTGNKALRAGDEVIITAQDLYDGKVVR